MNWGKRKKAAALLLVADMVLLGGALFVDRFMLGLALTIAGALLAATLWLVNKLLLKSAWYRALMVDLDWERFPGVPWTRTHIERNFALLNIGDQAARRAFNYSDVPVLAMNLAHHPQTLRYGLRVVKNFFSILRYGGWVIIPVGVHEGSDERESLVDAVRYARLLAPELIESRYRRLALFLARFPVFMGLARLYDRVVPGAAIDGAERATLLRELVDFCTARDLRPVFVILPASEAQLDRTERERRSAEINEGLAALERDVPILDYLRGAHFSAPEYYDAQMYLNESGAGAFTAQVVADLQRL